MKKQLLVSLLMFNLCSYGADNTATLKRALISVSDKTGIVPFAQYLLKNNFEIISTGNTYNMLKEKINSPHIQQVSDITGFPEILGGRVKTVHPIIHAGILAKTDQLDELKEHNIKPIDMVVCNLYPFEQTIAKANVTDEEAVEQIDIGGPAMLRAAAKNCARVITVSNPQDYADIIDTLNLLFDQQTGLKARKVLASLAFASTKAYDAAIESYFTGGTTKTITLHKMADLKYGCNPHQKQAALWSMNGQMPFKILNGTPGYINVLDALNGWALVKDIKRAFNKEAAASFKHTAPAGAAVAKRLTEEECEVFGLDQQKSYSLLESALIRARNGDPKSSYGDFIAISGIVDIFTAELIKSEVSDGIIALGFTDEALAILNKKKQGHYIVLEANPHFEQNTGVEFRETHGVIVSQEVDTQVTDASWLKNVVTKNNNLSKKAIKDLILTNITLKQTPSNSVVLAYNGQVIGVGAGQQNRVDCVELAGNKADTWRLRFTPEMKKKYADAPGSKTNKINTVCAAIKALERSEKEALLATLDKTLVVESEGSFSFPSTERVKDVVLASDAFFPFADNIEEAAKHNVGYIIQPGGSSRDDEVTAACENHNIVMVHTGVRIFTH